jgi:hypothetical protein
MRVSHDGSVLEGAARRMSLVSGARSALDDRFAAGERVP